MSRPEPQEATMDGADASIDALRAVHEDLVATVSGLDDDALLRPSGASQWSVAQVLSHLGSGAELGAATLRAGREGTAPMEQSSVEAVWDRWNAMTPQEQAAGFLRSDAAVLQAFDALDPATRREIRFPIPFLPEPADLELVTLMRLNEVTMHAWDVAVAEEPAATLHPAAVPQLLAGMSGPLGFLLAFMGRGATTDGTLAVRTSEPDGGFGLTLGEQVRFSAGPPGEADGTLTMPAEAFLRLLSGRLGPDHTPEGAAVTGRYDLDALRTAFPGY